MFLLLCPSMPDHHLTTTVQAAPQNVGKACCDNQQQAFSCFGGKCAGPTKFTFHRQSIPPCRSSPTRKARGSNPPGRTKSSTLWGAALFVMRGFYGAVKEGDSNSPCPAAWRIPLDAQKSALQCIFCNALFVLMLFRFRIILVAYHLPCPCTDLLLIVHFSVCL